MKKCALFIFLLVVSAATAVLAEDITLKTILPDQTVGRMKKAVVGSQSNSRAGNETWNYQTVDLLDNKLIVGTALGVGTSSPQAELHLKETGMGGTKNSPRFVMEDADNTNKCFLLEYDTENEGTASEIAQLEFYFPCDPASPSVGMFMRAEEDQTTRFMHKVVINPVSSSGRWGSLAVGHNSANCTLDSAGLIRTHTALQLKPTNINGVFGNPVAVPTDGEKHGVLTCQSGTNYIMRYVPETDTWVHFGRPFCLRYRGNGAASQTIVLGARPCSVKIVELPAIAAGGSASGAHIFYKHETMDVAVSGSTTNAIVTDGTSGNVYHADNIIQFNADGFTVYNTQVGPPGNNVRCNKNAVRYYYEVFFNGTDS